jgi:hypothetical protein
MPLRGHKEKIDRIYPEILTPNETWDLSLAIFSFELLVENPSGFFWFHANCAKMNRKD